MNSNMDFLRQEIEDLKKLGESWNMEKYQIEEAILKAIAGKLLVSVQALQQSFGTEVNNSQ